MGIGSLKSCNSLMGAGSTAVPEHIDLALGKCSLHRADVL